MPAGFACEKLDAALARQLDEFGACVALLNKADRDPAGKGLGQPMRKALAGDASELASLLKRSSDAALAARDAKETARVGDGDQRFNHWTAVRNGLMNAHAGLFAQLPEIMAVLPDPIDQMKLFQLIQIVPSPTRAALKSANLEAYRISDPRIMGYLRNNSIFTFGKADVAHPLFEQNTRELLSELARVPVVKYHAVTPAEGARTLLSYQNGEPALLERAAATRDRLTAAVEDADGDG